MEDKRLLFHVCCGPCSIALFEELKTAYTEVVAYFYNPNIHPEAEYIKRRDVVKQLCEKAGVPFIEGPYNKEHWFALTDAYKANNEGGARCKICFDMRLEEAMRYADEQKFDIVATSITSGRNKRADVINPLGNVWAETYGLTFLEADWKKGGRQEKGIQLAKEEDIYRQEYCGCIYSKLVREKKIKEKQ
ncbi:epoxyqueuosine reductase QueH [Patescibacteria group bacterium]|nr:epoxyqueuosine reductase QueH [Patescibacteria group bacterium]MBU1721747.1 epoxyqueuosine reductase QueH [Patescibacteria group bacterium]MBU1901414.1 epoxyqueuosine reductase QueH [Patescibacteria group bacterium]